MVNREWLSLVVIRRRAISVRAGKSDYLSDAGFPNELTEKQATCIIFAQRKRECVVVYGLNVKPEHGYYVGVKALDGDLKAVRIADDTPDGGLPLNQDYTFQAGRAIDPTNMPTKMQWQDRQKHAIPDFDSGLVLNVSERCKVLIEKIEPSVHQFLPVNYLDIDDKFLETRYFLIVCNRLDTVDREQTKGMMMVKNVMWRSFRDVARRRPEDIPAGGDPNAEPRIVYNLSQIGDAHIWCDKHAAWGEFISDELAMTLKGGGFTGLRLSEARVLDNKHGLNVR